jgi:hypothetical protein
MSILGLKRAVDQTRFYTGPGTTGNCMQAALATVLDLPLSQVPDFRLMEKGGWGGDAMVKWLAARARTCQGSTDEHDAPLFGLYVANGPSPRGTGHSIVKAARKMVHDPHPSRDGLVVETAYWWFTPIVLQEAVDDAVSGYIERSPRRKSLERALNASRKSRLK